MWGAQALFMVLGQNEADLEITPERFSIRPWGFHDMDYPLEAAPGVISLLVAGEDAYGRMVRKHVDRFEVPPVLGPAFVGPGRYVHASAWQSRIEIRLRRHEEDLDAAVPARDEKRYIPGRRVCPHCQVMPERYRVLFDDSLVCDACGASWPRAT